MASLPNVLELMFLWALFAASAATVVLAVRARRVEREEGLPASDRRVWSVGIVCGLVALLVGLATWSTFAPPADTESLADEA